VRQAWWTRRWFLLLVILASAIPLLWPETPPLVDLPGHMGRYRVELDLASSTTLQQFFNFRWSVVGNLGADLLVIPLTPLFGLEGSVKLIVIAIPLLTVSGLMWVALEIHGRLPPTALFAVPFAYGYPFNYGFLNFSLSMALALLAFGLWLRLERRSPIVRALIYIPLSVVIWTCHVFGWGMLGLMVWSAEAVRSHDDGSNWVRSGFRAAIRCLPLCVPIILMLIWRSGDVGGETSGFLAFGSKILALFSAVRDRWLLWDSFTVAVALVLLASAVFDRHLEFSRRLGIPAVVLAIVFVLMPGKVFGSAYADMRLIPYVLMIALIAMRPRMGATPVVVQRLAILGLAFAALRIGGNAVSFLIADREAQRELAALDYVPVGARVLSLVGNECGARWAMPRHSHFGSFVILRKNGFSNDQWQLPGAQLLSVVYGPAGHFMADPSEVTISAECKRKIFMNVGKRTSMADAVRHVRSKYQTADEALEQFPRSAFDFVWLVRPEGLTRMPDRNLTLVWSGPTSMLFKVGRPAS
jgi:hypothetical protein